MKRKRDDSSDEMAIEKALAKVVEEQIELVPTASFALIALMLESLFGIIETSSVAEVEASDEPIEVGVDAPSKVESKGHPIGEVEVGLEEGPLPM